MHYLLMTVKVYRGAWNDGELAPLDWAFQGWAPHFRVGETFYNTYTVSPGDDETFDLFEYVNNIVGAEQCILSGHSEIDRVLVVECDDAGGFTADTAARVFWIHDYERHCVGSVPGLHGWGGRDRFCALRVAWNRRGGSPTKRLYYDAVSGSDGTYEPLRYPHHGGLGLRTDGGLGAAYFAAYQEFMARCTYLDTVTSFDRNGASIGLWPRVGLPVLQVASIEVKARMRQACRTADDLRFERLNHEMLSTVLAGLLRYEQSYVGFRFVWGNGELPGWQDNGGQLHPDPINYFFFAQSGLPDLHTFPTRPTRPDWIVTAQGVFDLLREWRVLAGLGEGAARVNFKGNLELVAGVIEKIDSMEVYINDFWVRHAAYWDWFEAQPGGKNWGMNFSDNPQTFWWDNWVDLENWLFELARCCALLQVVSYIKPGGKLAKGSTIFNGVELDPTEQEHGRFDFPVHWESFRIGRGPFLTVETGPDNGIAVVFTGPEKPPWNPATDGVPTDALLYVLWGLWVSGNPLQDVDGYEFMLQAKQMWQIANPTQQHWLYLAMVHAVSNDFFEGNDPYPDMEPALVPG